MPYLFIFLREILAIDIIKSPDHMSGLCLCDYIQVIEVKVLNTYCVFIALLIGQDMMKRHQFEINNGKEDSIILIFNRIIRFIIFSNYMYIYLKSIHWKKTLKAMEFNCHECISGQNLAFQYQFLLMPLCLGQGKFKMSLQHLTISKSKEMFIIGTI